jgi:hypothetical protein
MIVMTLDISRFPPGLRCISFTPIVRSETGLSSDLLKASDFTTTSSIRSLLIPGQHPLQRVMAFGNLYLENGFLILNPTEETWIFVQTWCKSGDLI